MANNIISLTELMKTTRTTDKSLMGNMEGPTANKTAISVMYLALGVAARKQKRT